MNVAAQRIYSISERLQADRGAAVADVLTHTTGRHGLSSRGERDIRAAVMRHVDRILDLADSAVAARVELEAVERRLAHHMPGCPECLPLRQCRRYRAETRRRDNLQRRADAALLDLLEGYRR